MFSCTLQKVMVRTEAGKRKNISKKEKIIGEEYNSIVRIIVQLQMKEKERSLTVKQRVQGERHHQLQFGNLLSRELRE